MSLDSNNAIIKERNAVYEEAMQDWSVFIPEAYKDLSFYLGDQWSDSDKQYLRDSKRKAYVFNNIKRFVQQVTGYQRKNRLASICDPIEEKDQAVADINTDILLYIMQRCGGYNKLSDAFEGACITGIDLMSVWIDYSVDRIDGDIKISREPFNQFILDTKFTQLDLSDCRYILRRRYLNNDECVALIPGKSSEIQEMKPTGIQDGKFTYMPASRKGIESGLFRYDEYWKRVTRKKKLLIDGMTGESVIWNGTNAALKQYLSDYPFVEAQDITVNGVNLCITIDDVVMYDDIEPTGIDNYPFALVLAYHYPQYDKYDYSIQGIVRQLRDSQEECNRMMSKASDIIHSQVNSGWLVTEGSVTNPEDLYKSGQGVVIERKRTSQPSDVTKIMPAELSQAIPAMIEMLQRNILELGGGNQELLGVAEGGNTEVSGILAKQRSANALVTLQMLFDNLSLSQKILSEICIRIAQKWSPAKIQRITGKHVPEGYNDVDMSKYDVVVKETLLTDTQRNIHYLQLIEAKKAGIPIPDSAMLKALPITNKTELLQEFQQEQEFAKQQQVKINAQEELQFKIANAKIIADLSLATERRARAEADIGLLKSRTSESIQNIADAQLTQAKTITEIQGAEQSQLKEAIDTVLALQDRLQQKSDSEVVQEHDSKFEDMARTNMMASMEAKQQMGNLPQQPQEQLSPYGEQQQ